MANELHSGTMDYRHTNIMGDNMAKILLVEDNEMNRDML